MDIAGAVPLVTSGKVGFPQIDAVGTPLSLGAHGRGRQHG